jgi:hypothetical protein
LSRLRIKPCTSSMLWMDLSPNWSRGIVVVEFRRQVNRARAMKARVPRL